MDKRGSATLVMGELVAGMMVAKEKAAAGTEAWMEVAVAERLGVEMAAALRAAVVVVEVHRQALQEAVQVAASWGAEELGAEVAMGAAVAVVSEMVLQVQG